MATDLQVGNNSSSTTAGSGLVNALDGAQIKVTGAIRLGDTTAGSGTLTCREGGAITAHSIICDADGGLLSLLGGETRVDGGVLTAPNNILAIDGAAGENPVLRLLNGATCSLSAPSSPFRALTIGSVRSGQFVVDSGSSLTVTNGDAILGVLGGSNGFLTFAGGTSGTFPALRRITIGSSGFGDMTVSVNATVSAGSVELGAGPTGNGTLLVFGGDLTLAGTLSVGGTPTLGGGFGEVRVEAGGVLTVNGTGDAGHVHGGGTVLLSPGATLRVPNGNFSLVSGAGLNIDNGTLEAQFIQIGVLNPSLRGTLKGSVLFNAGASVVNPTGPLTINGGTGPSSIGNCTLGPQGLINGTATLVLASGRTLSGDGTINNDITNSGTITATGDGLTFGGMVTGVGQGMSGVRFTFASGGGFTGAGSINAKVVGQPSSTLTFDAPSTVGDGTIFGFSTDGQVFITNGTVTLSDSNGVGLGSLTSIRNNSTLACASTIGMGDAPTLDVLEGEGVVSANITCAGLLRPGVANGDPTGLLSVLGSLQLFSGTAKGQTEIEIGGPSTSDRDRVFATGPITLDGTLTLDLINGFEPANGFRALIISSTQSVSGGFVTKNLPVRWHVEIGPKNVVAVFCAGDINSDGFVNGDDFDDLASAFENGEPLGDFNGDGFINGDDFDQFASAFEEGC